MFLKAEPNPVKRISYGSAPEQFGELRIPIPQTKNKGGGPFPVVVLVHGGCWLAQYDLTYLTPLADWLTDQGFATWTIEYRRLGNPGGGWPGTFLDAARAVDKLREIARTSPLDLSRVCVLGHSAGGQLALWLASRGRLKSDSELYLKDPLAIHGVIGLAAITDLEKYRIGEPGSCHASVDLLLGGSLEKVPFRYRETSPLQLLPLGVAQVFIQGENDPIVDLASVQDYVRAASKSGDQCLLLSLPQAGHFEATEPTPESRLLLDKALRYLLSPDTRGNLEKK